MISQALLDSQLWVPNGWCLIGWASWLQTTPKPETIPTDFVLSLSASQFEASHVCLPRATVAWELIMMLNDHWVEPVVSLSLVMSFLFYSNLRTIDLHGVALKHTPLQQFYNIIGFEVEYEKKHGVITSEQLAKLYEQKVRFANPDDAVAWIVYLTWFWQMKFQFFNSDFSSDDFCTQVSASFVDTACTMGNRVSCKHWWALVQVLFVELSLFGASRWLIFYWSLMIVQQSLCLTNGQNFKFWSSKGGHLMASNGCSMLCVWARKVNAVSFWLNSFFYVWFFIFSYGCMNKQQGMMGSLRGTSAVIRPPTVLCRDLLARYFSLRSHPWYIDGEGGWVWMARECQNCNPRELGGPWNYSSDPCLNLTDWIWKHNVLSFPCSD